VGKINNFRDRIIPNFAFSWSAVINKQKGRAPAVEGIGNCADALS